MTERLELSDLCEFLDYRRRPVKESDRVAGPYPYYGANGQQGWINDYLFDEPLVLLAEDGGHFSSTEKPIAYKISGRTWVNNHAHVLRPKPICDIDYLHHALSYYDVTKFISGSTRLKLTKGDAETIVIPMRSLEQQRQIAEELNKADRLRRTRHYAQTLSDTFLQSVFLEMFGTLNELPSIEFVECWSESAKNGLYLPASKYGSGTPIIRINNFYSGKLTDISSFRRATATLKEKTDFSVQNGDILINRVNSLEYLGKCALVSGLTETTIFESNMMRIRVDENVVAPLYLTHYLTGSHAQNQILQRAKKAVNQASINQQDVEGLKIPMPPMKLQRAFSQVVAQHTHQQNLQMEAHRQADHLFHSLLHRAFQTDN